jgi:hypothetical protein
MVLTAGSSFQNFRYVFTRLLQNNKANSIKSLQIKVINCSLFQAQLPGTRLVPGLNNKVNKIIMIAHHDITMS